MDVKVDKLVVEEVYVYFFGVVGGKEIVVFFGVDYFVVKVELGFSGVIKVYDFGNVFENEKELFSVVIKDF